GRLRVVARGSGQRIPRRIELHRLADPVEIALDPRVGAGLAVAAAALLAPAHDADHGRRAIRQDEGAAAVALAGRSLRIRGTDDFAVDLLRAVAGQLPAALRIHHAQVHLHQDRA